MNGGTRAKPCARGRLSYNANGHLKQAIDTQGRITFNYYSNAQGLVLQRTESKADQPNSFLHLYYYAAGRRVGDVSTDPTSQVRISYAEQLAIDLQAKPDRGWSKFKDITPVTSADFDQNYEPINSSYPGPTAGTYTVRSGDSLRSIAQTLWGDAAMWYFLAEANGITEGSPLSNGQVLVVPNKVTNIHNNANTYRPYNPGEVIGNIDPTLPTPPPPPQKGCGTLGIILMVVVAVAVTVWTAGAAASALGVVGSTATGAAASTFGTGLAVLSGGTAAGITTAAAAGGIAASIGVATAGVAAAAVGSAAGSIASQLVGKATGNIEHFQWANVSRAAFTGGVTAGVGSMLNQAAAVGGALNGTWAGSAISAGGWQGAALRAGAGQAAVMGLKGEWNWRQLAASSVAAGVTHAVSNSSILQSAMSSFNPQFSQIALNTLGAAAGGWAGAQAVGYNRQESRSQMGQAFISGLGNAIALGLGGGAGADAGRGAASQRAADNRSLLNDIERAIDPARYTSSRFEFPDLSAFSGQPWSGDSGVAPVDRSNDVLLAAGPGGDRLTLRDLGGGTSGRMDAGYSGIQRMLDRAQALQDQIDALRGAPRAPEAPLAPRQPNIRYLSESMGPSNYRPMASIEPLSNVGTFFSDIGVSLPALSVELPQPSMSQQALGTAVMSAADAIAEVPFWIADTTRALGAMAYMAATNKTVELNFYSGLGRQAQGGASSTELLHGLNPMYGLMVGGYESWQGIERGDTRPLAAMSGSILGGAYAAKGSAHLPGVRPGTFSPGTINAVKAVGRSVADTAAPWVQQYFYRTGVVQYVVPPGGSQTSAPFGRFPSDPQAMTNVLGVQPKKVGVTPDGTTRVVWEPNSNTRIRFESHPEGLQSSDPGFNPRHHGEHYHIEIKPASLSWSQANKQGLIIKVKPDNYKPGMGTGFLAGEAFPE